MRKKPEDGINSSSDTDIEENLENKDYQQYSHTIIQVLNEVQPEGTDCLADKGCDNDTWKRHIPFLNSFCKDPIQFIHHVNIQKIKLQQWDWAFLDILVKLSNELIFQVSLGMFETDKRALLPAQLLLEQLTKIKELLQKFYKKENIEEFSQLPVLVKSNYPLISIPSITLPQLEDSFGKLRDSIQPSSFEIPPELPKELIFGVIEEYFKTFPDETLKELEEKLDIPQDEFEKTFSQLNMDDTSQIPLISRLLLLASVTYTRNKQPDRLNESNRLNAGILLRTISNGYLYNDRLFRLIGYAKQVLDKKELDYTTIKILTAYPNYSHCIEKDWTALKKFFMEKNAEKQQSSVFFLFKVVIYTFENKMLKKPSLFAPNRYSKPMLDPRRQNMPSPQKRNP